MVPNAILRLSGNCNMKLSKCQKIISDDNSRFRVAICGRRFGKTFLAINELAKFACIPNREVFYVAPSYRQAKQIVWKKLRNRLQELRWVKKVHETELSLLLKNGSTISLKGADNYDSLRGVGLDFVVLDEFADIDEECWYEVLRPALADNEGHALFIGTPKGKSNWSFDLYNNERYSDDWQSFQYTTLDGGNVSEKEIEDAKKDMDERTFNQEFNATFETYGSIIAYNFDRNIHVAESDDINIRDFNEIHVGLDFNNSPITAAIMVRIGNTLYQFDEIYMNNSNTNELAQEIKNRYPNYKINCYPDPAGRQRKTSANGQTDFTILENYGFKVFAPLRHNEIKDRINSFNSRLRTMDNKVHYYISPKCKHTIESLEKYAYKDGTQIPDKNGFDHMFDALTYCVDYLFPLKRIITEQRPAQRFGHSLA